MPRKSKKPVRKQTHSPTGKVVGQVGQILLPMIAGIAATKADLTEWVYEQGLTALHLLLREDAEEIAGLKGKHEKERTHNHCGSTNGELSFGGRRIQVSRPRVRSKSGEEASLPHFEAFREEDPLPERVLNQIWSSLNFPVKSPYGSPRSVKLLIPPTCLAGEARCEAPRLS